MFGGGAVALLLALALVIPALFMRPDDPQLVVSDDPAPGDRIQVVGAAFPVGVRVTFTWNEFSTGASARANSFGSFALWFTVPDDAVAGAHLLRAYGETGGTTRLSELAATTVNVRPTAATSPPSPTAPAALPSTMSPDEEPPTPTPSTRARPTTTATPVISSDAPQSAVTPIPAATASPTAPPHQDDVWTRVVDDQFNSGGVPAHWNLYNGPYGSGPGNCAIPSHASVAGGALRLLLSYESSGICGPGWYSAGMMVDSAHGGIDQRVTLRFRITRLGAASHYVLPMRWPTTDAWPAAGEEDYCEGDELTGCATFLHYGSDNQQIQAAHAVDLGQWHTLRFERRDHVIRVFIDDMSRPAWTYEGSAQTLPDTFKRVVLQQECQESCPTGTTGSEVIEIDWITIDDPRQPSP